MAAGSTPVRSKVGIIHVVARTLFQDQYLSDVSLTPRGLAGEDSTTYTHPPIRVSEYQTI
jgi:hypothetical protein